MEILPRLLNIGIQGIVPASVNQNKTASEHILPVIGHAGLLQQHDHQVPGPPQGVP